MKWEKAYKQKLVSAEEAVSHIQSGNRVVAGHDAVARLNMRNRLFGADQFLFIRFFPLHHFPPPSAHVAQCPFRIGKSSGIGCLSF